MERHQPVGVRKALASVLAGAFLLTLSACPKDEYDPDTWIDKLDDPESADEFNYAITKLEQLRDPKAIGPLTKAWEKYNRDSKVLRAIVHLADQEEFQGKKGPFWEKAIPLLEKAVSEYDVGDPRSREDAMYAADALGRAGDPSVIPTLIDAATKKMPKLSPGQNVRIAALRGLGYFGSNERAVDTLIRVLETDTDEQDVRLHAAAANALAETGHPKALQPLLKALFSISIIYPQVRNAITRLGPVAVPELIKIFEGKHQEIAKFAKDNEFATDCSKASGPETKCKAPGNLRFKASVLLGDLYAKDAAGMLARALKTSSQVSFFDPRTGAPGPPDHSGILDALKKIRDPSTAGEVLGYARDSGTDDEVRPLAYDVYSMIARDRKGLDYFAGVIKDDSIEEDQIREAAGLAFARLATQKKDLSTLDSLRRRYADLAVSYDKKAKSAKKKSDKEYNERTANQYRATAGMFEQYNTRARVGIECGGKVECYVEILKLEPDALVKKVGVPGAEEMKRGEKNAHRIAASERALLDLGKMGPEAKAALPALLELVESSERIIREGVLLAMVQVTGPECKECIARLDEVIEAQKTQTTLDVLTADTRIVLHYYQSRSK
jgi:HEAT repeat protein